MVWTSDVCVITGGLYLTVLLVRVGVQIGLGVMERGSQESALYVFQARRRTFSTTHKQQLAYILMPTWRTSWREQHISREPRCWRGGLRAFQFRQTGRFSHRYFFPLSRVSIYAVSERPLGGHSAANIRFSYFRRRSTTFELTLQPYINIAEILRLPLKKCLSRMTAR